jgi:small conductance mechanosensitive channel
VRLRCGVPAGAALSPADVLRATPRGRFTEIGYNLCRRRRSARSPCGRAATAIHREHFMDMETIKTFLGTTAIDIGLKVLAAIAFWIIGRWMIGRVIALMQAAMNRNHVDPTLTKYLGSIIAIALNIALVLGILGYFGIQTTSFAAMLAGAGVAIGAAWSGLLGNFAAGAFMLILRPFKVGDFVSIGGIVGTVHELGLFGTTIVTPDNVMTLVGNGKIFGDTIQNFSVLPVRRVERVAQLANGVDALDAIARLKAAVALIPNVSKEMPPEVSLLDFKLEGPQIAVRPYTHTDHYWQVYFDTNEAIVKVCKEAGWPVPSALHQVRQV